LKGTNFSFPTSLTLQPYERDDGNCKSHIQPLAKLLNQLIQFQISNSNTDLQKFRSFFFVIEMKGTKHFTKAKGSVPVDCLRRCFLNFQRQFSGLDWDYMINPGNGTLVVDLGMTHHPVNGSTPLVEIWCLDSLEASFGATGLCHGTIHHLNTLSLYGGLQAEMHRKHMECSHVVFQSSYNLGYEVTRSLDNNRELFHDKDAYGLEPEYLHNIKQVLEIYTNKAAQKSFGVRDEIHMGGGGIPHADQ
jgi:hypothetical protein